LNHPFRFLDLACGTGQSTRSFLELGLSATGIAIDVDPEMVATCREALAKDFPEVEVKIGRDETIPLPDRSVDLVLVGSAIHWFDLGQAKSEIERILCESGSLYVFEYQFPKCLDDPELAEATRRRFNLEWKAPVQKPRGTLADLLAPFRLSEGWKIFADDRPEWRETLTLEAFLGHLFSQSRYLHAEATSEDPAAYRNEIAESFRRSFANGPLLFDFKPRVIGLKKV